MTEAANPTEWKGQNSGVHNEATTVAKTQAEWVQLWDATFSNTWPAPKAPELPEGKMAIGIFAGMRSNPAELTITGVTEANGTANVTYTQVGRSSMLAVMNEPFILKFVDATDLPVTFTKETPKPTTPAVDFKSLKRIGFGNN